MDNLTPVGRIIAWTMLALASTLLVTHVPSFLGLVSDDARYGRFVGRSLFFPLFVVSLVSGALYASGRRRLAFWMIGVTLAGLVLLEVYLIRT